MAVDARPLPRKERPTFYMYSFHCMMLVGAYVFSEEKGAFSHPVAEALVDADLEGDKKGLGGPPQPLRTTAQRLVRRLNSENDHLDMGLSRLS